MTQNVSKFRRLLPLLTIAFTFLTVSTMGLLWLKDQLNEPVAQVKPAVQIVNIVRPPPPPPEIDEPPPPPEVEEEVELPEPEPLPELADMPDEAPPGEQLGLDADGVAGADGFGLVANKGGRSLIGGGGGSSHRFYAQQVQNQLSNLLSETDEVRKQKYSVDVKLWLDDEGDIRNVILNGSTGDTELDRLLTETLRSASTSAGEPPQDMPQPIRLRIVSRI